MKAQKIHSQLLKTKKNHKACAKLLKYKYIKSSLAAADGPDEDLTAFKRKTTRVSEGVLCSYIRLPVREKNRTMSLKI